MTQTEEAQKTVALGELTRDASVACIDGRHSGCIVGAPGGNMGEFILLLSALESLDSPFDDGQIREFLNGYLSEFGRFYMHTDRHAMNWIARQLSRDGFTADDIKHTPVAEQERLLELLTTPEGVGCGHLSLMLQHPDEYGVRKDLVRGAIRAFFNQLWATNPSNQLEFVVLEGDHQETELVIYQADDELNEHTNIPMVCAHSDKKFVLHDAARRFLLKRSQDFFSKVRGLTADEDDEFRAKVDELADIQLEATRKALFPTLPHRVIQIVA